MRIFMMFMMVFLMSAMVLAVAPTDAGSGAMTSDSGKPELTGQTDGPMGGSNKTMDSAKGMGDGSEAAGHEVKIAEANKGEDFEIQNKVELQAQEIAQKKEMIQNKVAAKGGNEVRVAVHTLMAMGEVEGIGPKISEIARDMNKSMEKAEAAEVQMKQKSAFSRFFSGGDEKAADDMEEEMMMVQNMIIDLKAMHEGYGDNADIKEMLQEQIKLMEQEHSRLQELAEKEKSSKGLFGWLWK